MSIINGTPPRLSLRLPAEVQATVADLQKQLTANPQMAQALGQWASDLGFSLDRLDSPGAIVDFVRWAQGQGSPMGGRDLLAWAARGGFKEGDSLGVVTQSYDRVAERISTDMADRTPLAEEGSVSLPAGIGDVDSGAVYAQLGSLVAVATGQTAAAVDAAGVLTEILGPPSYASMREIASDVRRLGAEIRDQPGAATSSATGRALAGMARRGNIDVNALVQQVLREAYADQLGDLRAAAEKVKFHNDLKKQMRAELEKARTAMAAAPSDAKKPDSEIALAYDGVVFDPEPSYDDEGRPIVRPTTPQAAADGSGAITNKEQLRTYIQNLESQLNTVGEDAQMANMDLQNITQRQQQLMQTMSNMSRGMHDAAMAVIRNIH